MREAQLSGGLEEVTTSGQRAEDDDGTRAIEGRVVVVVVVLGECI